MTKICQKTCISDSTAIKKWLQDCVWAGLCLRMDKPDIEFKRCILAPRAH